MFCEQRQQGALPGRIGPGEDCQPGVELDRQLLELPWRTDELGNRVPYILSLSIEARETLRACQEWIEPRLGENGELAAIADWGLKLSGGIARIAGLLHHRHRYDLRGSEQRVLWTRRHGELLLEWAG